MELFGNGKKIIEYIVIDSIVLSSFLHLYQNTYTYSKLAKDEQNRESQNFSHIYIWKKANTISYKKGVVALLQRLNVDNCRIDNFLYRIFWMEDIRN